MRRSRRTATATLRIDRHAPATPIALAVSATRTRRWRWCGRILIRGRRRRSWVRATTSVTPPGRTASPRAFVPGRDIARVPSVAIPAGEHVVRVWLQDEAGNVDPATAATLAVDPSTVSARRAVDTNPPVLLPDGPAPSAKLRITKARRTGSTLTLSGTIARGATATIQAAVARTKTGKAVATAKTKPRRGSGRCG